MKYIDAMNISSDVFLVLAVNTLAINLITYGIDPESCLDATRALSIIFGFFILSVFYGTVAALKRNSNE